MAVFARGKAGKGSSGLTRKLAPILTGLRTYRALGTGADGISTLNALTVEVKIAKKPDVRFSVLIGTGPIRHQSPKPLPHLESQNLFRLWNVEPFWRPPTLKVSLILDATGISYLDVASKGAFL